MLDSVPIMEQHKTVTSSEWFDKNESSNYDKLVTWETCQCFVHWYLGMEEVNILKALNLK